MVSVGEDQVRLALPTTGEAAPALTSNCAVVMFSSPARLVCVAAAGLADPVE